MGRKAWKEFTERGMNKAEFLEQLRLSLNGRMDASQVMDNLRYYEEYINSQLRQGKTEEDVMSMLGSPRLIARTITDANTDGCQAGYRAGTVMVMQNATSRRGISSHRGPSARPFSTGRARRSPTKTTQAHIPCLSSSFCFQEGFARSSAWQSPSH